MGRGLNRMRGSCVDILGWVFRHRKGAEQEVSGAEERAEGREQEMIVDRLAGAGQRRAQGKFGVFTLHRVGSPRGFEQRRNRIWT